MIFSTFPGSVVLGFPLCEVSEFLSLRSPPRAKGFAEQKVVLATSERVNQTSDGRENHTAIKSILRIPIALQ
jgi:hypothetical protein